MGDGDWIISCHTNRSNQPATWISVLNNNILGSLESHHNLLSSFQTIGSQAPLNFIWFCGIWDWTTAELDYIYIYILIYLFGARPAPVSCSACSLVRGYPCSTQPLLTQSNWVRRSLRIFNTIASGTGNKFNWMKSKFNRHKLW